MQTYADTSENGGERTGLKCILSDGPLEGSTLVVQDTFASIYQVGPRLSELNTHGLMTPPLTTTSNTKR